MISVNDTLLAATINDDSLICDRFCHVVSDIDRYHSDRVCDQYIFNSSLILNMSYNTVLIYTIQQVDHNVRASVDSPTVLFYNGP
jgi:hypothetical protein